MLYRTYLISVPSETKKNTKIKARKEEERDAIFHYHSLEGVWK